MAQFHGQHAHFLAGGARGFTVKHYAGDVNYRAAGFGDANRDALRPDLVRARVWGVDLGPFPLHPLPAPPPFILAPPPSHFPARSSFFVFFLRCLLRIRLRIRLHFLLFYCRLSLLAVSASSRALKSVCFYFKPCASCSCVHLQVLLCQRASWADSALRSLFPETVDLDDKKPPPTAGSVIRLQCGKLVRCWRDTAEGKRRKHVML